jgi:hypothetical protein
MRNKRALAKSGSCRTRAANCAAFCTSGVGPVAPADAVLLCLSWASFLILFLILFLLFCPAEFGLGME